jgi:hypothetical protein
VRSAAAGLEAIIPVWFKTVLGTLLEVWFRV